MTSTANSTQRTVTIKLLLKTLHPYIFTHFALLISTSSGTTDNHCTDDR